MEFDPRRHHAVLFDLDGVLADTTALHFRAWKRLFDEYLSAHQVDTSTRSALPLEFSKHEYQQHVDGKPRVAGVVSFLESRGIAIPVGSPQDSSSTLTAYGLGKRKDEFFEHTVTIEGISVFDGTRKLLEQLRGCGIKIAVVSASRHCADILERTGMTPLVDVRIDGLIAADLALAGKPSPDTFLQATRQLGLTPSACVVVEDSESGVKAGQRGKFAAVVGIERDRSPERLLNAGATTVVPDLVHPQVLTGQQQSIMDIPDALVHWPEFTTNIRNKIPLVVLDFDGTLAPITRNPTKTTLPTRNHQALRTLAGHCPVAILSGRNVTDVQQRVDIRHLWYIGNHGFQLAHPDGTNSVAPVGQPALAELNVAEQQISRDITTPGTFVERKDYALAVHYRNTPAGTTTDILDTVTAIASPLSTLTVRHGRYVIELIPDTTWNKGTALDWVTTHLAPSPYSTTIYVGDDTTDEDALRAVSEFGTGIVIHNSECPNRMSWARFGLSNPTALTQLLEQLATVLASIENLP